MIRRTTPGKSSLKSTALFAYAAGATGILANLFLIVFYVLYGLQAGRPKAQTSLGFCPAWSFPPTLPLFGHNEGAVDEALREIDPSALF